MKLPKLKYYYLALAPDGYADFERTRELPITGVNIDIVTGTVTGRDSWHLAATPAIADDLVREAFRYGGHTYVLRIPAESVDRSLLKPVPNQSQIWQYSKTLHVPHCGVYRYEINQESAA